MGMDRLLVTGGAGFIGSNFIRYVLGRDPEVRVVNLDLLTYSGNLENLKPLSDPDRYTFIQGDICDSAMVEQLLRECKVNIIIHFAAETHVDRSILDPDPFIHTNVLGTTTLLEAIRRYWMEESGAAGTQRRFHHISTDEVYGSLAPGEPAWTEESPYDPRSPYAASKAASDHLVRAYGHTYGLPYVITNCTNNYGPFQYPEKLIPLMILNALEGKPLPVYGDGRQVRDWLHVEDHCEAIAITVKNGQPRQSYNIGGGNQLTNIEIVEMICKVLDNRLPDSPHRPHRHLIQFVKDRPGHDRRYALDYSKIRRDLGWQPRHNLKDGLAETVDWYLAHPDWVEGIRRKREYQEWMGKIYSQ
jgi:dTDP-glucose 4,6-dehydratase